METTIIYTTSDHDFLQLPEAARQLIKNCSQPYNPPHRTSHTYHKFTFGVALAQECIELGCPHLLAWVAASASNSGRESAQDSFSF
ncbi:hypothetical protein kac65v162_gp120 [Nodularia phage vB_NspS-kac65v162]|jgi:hypothetical protein|uniref:Uncharacterized protein n=5 Tax=Ravarandavirus TaxID=2843444 RepID=A0A482MK43_9CAUD|nr:hypothetical protein HWC12_gp197 [Nodularia phage vB_NspS-kac65v151]YP_009844931.1 hypothetical protein HWC13_gp189 [Nodularia phage vB_NspS-kac68v161]QBQ73358.1 hypothetical protein kac65v161_gp120 [Nodularia phage vB_NspS-kac65v161]QBQ73564.1 hypothetical protein kac65v162_gp120 [Nodularia phage vB_NspS-kac65v162]QBQ73968.1 hypothetical protein kac68v162_gp120 [Nodularia phage vB_NspS-kac68v162]QBQ73150.1 hypothetical protein kac65v151_gp120 [Nodularia phage vB_NspS-kac65v151]QBQ73772.1 